MLFFLTCVVQQLRQAVRTFRSSNVPEASLCYNRLTLQRTSLLAAVFNFTGTAAGSYETKEWIEWEKREVRKDRGVGEQQQQQQQQQVGKCCNSWDAWRPKNIAELVAFADYLKCLQAVFLLKRDWFCFTHDTTLFYTVIFGPVCISSCVVLVR